MTRQGRRRATSPTSQSRAPASPSTAAASATRSTARAARGGGGRHRRPAREVPEGGSPPSATRTRFLQPECSEDRRRVRGRRQVIADKGLTVYWDNITEESWNAGSRKVNCNLAALLPDRSGFAPVTGSVKGAVVGGRRSPRRPRTDTPDAGRAGPPTDTRAAAPRGVLRPGAGVHRAVRRPRTRRPAAGAAPGAPAPWCPAVVELPVALRRLRPSVDMTRREFEGLVSDALDTIPPELTAAMDNVVVLVEGRNDEEPGPARALRGRRAHRADVVLRRRPARPDHDLPGRDPRHLRGRATRWCTRWRSPSCTRWRTTSASTRTTLHDLGWG